MLANEFHISRDMQWRNGGEPVARLRFPPGEEAAHGAGVVKILLPRALTQKGKLVEDPAEARKAACVYLGKELCPFGKADEDLLSITVMGLINDPTLAKGD